MIDETTLEIIRRITELEEEQKRLASLVPLFPIFNLAEAENLVADATNYALGDYGIVTLNPTANRIIRGMTNGVRGRVLLVRNTSAGFTLTFTNEDALATAENRIVTPSTASVVLGTRQTAIFFYRILTGATSRWMLVFPIA